MSGVSSPLPRSGRRGLKAEEVQFPNLKVAAATATTGTLVNAGTTQRPAIGVAAATATTAGALVAADKARLDNAFGADGWTAFAYNSYFQAFPGYGVPQWRREGNRVYLRGLVLCRVATGTPPWGTGMASPPPSATRLLGCLGGGAAYAGRDLRVATDGTWGVYVAAMAVGDWFSLDGLFYEVV